ncbi:hypothetical protein F5Y09DRAFT_143255 [Xylaria sp. FL1042]|nr:hypothetical protein F5Y09DRAFT_143255 [Xylaria sp. FL1042]
MPSSPLIRIFRLPSSLLSLRSPLVHLRKVRHQAHDLLFDPDDLEEARKWHASFNKDSLPKAQTTYSRSSGPGGQHVNKTESKATSVWTVSELSKVLPKLMCLALRSSRYYFARHDSIIIHAQTHRSRTANTNENHEKFVDELIQIYHKQIPRPTSEKKIKKHEAAEKAFNQHRLKLKKQQTSKKASRKGGQHE